MPRVTEATDVMRVLKEKLREFNINPEFVTVDRVEKVNGKWVVVFYHFFRRYVVEVDEEGRILSLKSGAGLGEAR